MSETSLAGLFIALAVLIVLSGPARLLRVTEIICDVVRAVWRRARRGTPKAATGD